MHYTGDGSFTLEQLYLLCVKFIKEKEGKAFHLSYQDRLQLSAHCKQVAHGPFKADASPGVGWLDVVGGDRKAAWKALGDLSRERAQEKFVEIIDRACPLLGPYLEAHLNEKREHDRQLQEEAEERLREAERQKQRELEEQQQQQQRKLAEEAAAAELRSRQEASRARASTAESRSSAAPTGGSKDESRRHQQEAQIRAALNQQTAAQFRQYAAEQHPGDAGKQEELVAQLQDQHYQQYMAQVYQQQLRYQEELTTARRAQAPAAAAATSNGAAAVGSEAAAGAGAGARQPPSPLPLTSPQQPTAAAAATDAKAIEAEESSTDAARASSQPPPGLVTGDRQQLGNGAASSTTATTTLMAAPSMWSHRQLNVAQFKANLAADADAKLKIGPGEVVTVRVPTHEEGTCIVWEFATDYYDIGFGVYFEWTISPSDRVTVHISESSDEEDEGDDEAAAGDEGDAAGAANAAESAGVSPAGVASEADGGGASTPASASKRRKAQDETAIDEIIPVYRRDCHEEVYCGSHQYPGRGVYLLKFDNSYSLWRSKWLYYRVYYTK